jgi:predicted Zn-dependent peptidase
MPGRETVAAGVWITRGAAHDPESVAGATHMVEHLTLRACGGHDRRSLALTVDRLGGEVDAWTSSEMMGITLNTTVDALGDALDLLVDALLTPTFKPEDVELERRVTQAELDLLADDPSARVEQALLQAAWGKHPLARPVIGSHETLASLTPAVLEDHHATLIRPGGLLAAVVGDVTSEKVVQHLARLPLAYEPRVAALPALRWRGKRLDVGREGIDQVHARLGFEAPAAGDPRVPALVILNRILGDGASSRLFQRLREDEGLTYDVWSAPVLRRLGGLLEIGWACAPRALPDAWKLVVEELHRVTGNLDSEEVEVAKEGLLRGLQMDVESPGVLCSLDVGELLDRGRRFDTADARRELEEVSVEDVQRMAVEVLRPDRMASAVCGPKGVAALVA